MTNAQNKTLLIVDDDINFRSLLAYLLGRAGYKITQAGNGQEALELLANPQQESPGLILLDLNMPVMDGWKFRQRQLETPPIANIPVVVITSTKTEGADLASIRANECLKKPIQAEQLVELVARLLAVKPGA